MATGRGADDAAPGPRRGLALAAVVTTGLALWLTVRSWGRGQLLYRDFVSVPDPVLGPAALGADGQPPRAVPLDAVMAVLAPVLPSWVQQQAMLAGVLVLAGTGVAVLLRRHGAAAMVSGAAVATWNPYVAERLLVGQPPTLLAYSMIPWLVAAVRSRLRPALRFVAVLAAALPAALTPWGGVVAGVVVLGTALLAGPRQPARLVSVYAGAAVLWCLPWVAAAARSGAPAAEPDGARAFAVGADSWAGTVGSVLTLGGIWAPAARLDSREGLVPVLSAAVLVGLAAWGLRRVRLTDGRRAALLLAAAWGGPTALVLLASAGPGLTAFAALQSVPGVALFRDTHRLLALPALVVAVLVGRAVDGMVRRAGPPGVGAVALGFAAPVVVVSLSAMTAPELASRLDAAYRPTSFPGEWAQVVAAVGEDTESSRVLVLPWQPFRQVGWAGPQPFLDPFPRALRAETLTSNVLTVPRDGAALSVGSDPPEGRSWRDGALAPEVLRRMGIGFVIEWKGTPGTLPTEHPGLTRVHSGPSFAVWAVGTR